jgi:hypothetical protein
LATERLHVSFADLVLDHQNVTVTGAVTSLDTVDGELRTTGDVQLQRAGESVVTGVAVLALRQQ